MVSSIIPPTADAAVTSEV